MAKKRTNRIKRIRDFSPTAIMMGCTILVCLELVQMIVHKVQELIKSIWP